ncbi:MAG: O-antigen ligase family protein [Bdellovibrionota bacterium]
MNAPSQRKASDALQEVYAVTDSPSGERLVQSLLMLNLAILFLRPQDIVPIVGTLRIPVAVSILCVVAWLGRAGRRWETQMKIIFLFLSGEALRTMIGKLVWDDLVRNDFWAFYLWRDLFFQYLGFVFPMVAFMSTGRGLRVIARSWLLISGLLAAWAITHHGTGPGGFVEDENDLGLTLLTFLPMALGLATEWRYPERSRLFSFLVAGLIILGAMVTFSRGTFVGLLCVLACFIWRSQRKFAILATGTLLVLCALPFVPRAYIERIGTIKDTNEGTADLRRHYWNIAGRIFLDPKHMAFGVGLGNATFHLADYETGEDLAHYPSSAGRAVHSIYFELLPDLGLWGIAIVSSLVTISFRRNARLSRVLAFQQQLIANELSSTPTEQQPAQSSVSDSERESALSALSLLSREYNLIRPMLLAANLAFVAIFTAGAFISVLYYPMLWIACGLSATLTSYSRRLLPIFDELSQLGYVTPPATR